MFTFMHYIMVKFAKYIVRTIFVNYPDTGQKGHTQKKPPSISASLKKIPLNFGLPQKIPPQLWPPSKKSPSNLASLNFGLPQ